MTFDKTRFIAYDNDQFRQNLGYNDLAKHKISGKYKCDQWVHNLSEKEKYQVWKKIWWEINFPKAIDPTREHRRGIINIQDKKVEWVIDYYDFNYKNPSSNILDSKTTRRIMTISLLKDETEVI